MKKTIMASAVLAFGALPFAAFALDAPAKPPAETIGLGVGLGSSIGATANIPEENTLLLGTGVGVSARYAGSRKNEAGLGLLIDYRMANGFFASTLQGVGWGGQSGPLSYSAALAYRAGRAAEKKTSGIFGSSANEDLRGMGEVKGSAISMLSLGYRPIEALELTAALEAPVSHRQNGLAFHLGATADVYETTADKLSFGATASGGDRKYMQTYFGVSSQQSATSGYQTFTPKNGFHALDLSATWVHRFDDRWSLSGSVGATRLLGDAAKSPFVKRKTTPTAAVFLTYRY